MLFHNLFFPHPLANWLKLWNFSLWPFCHRQAPSHPLLPASSVMKIRQTNLGNRVGWRVSFWVTFSRAILGRASNFNEFGETGWCCRATGATRGSRHSGAGSKRCAHSFLLFKTPKRTNELQLFLVVIERLCLPFHFYCYLISTRLIEVVHKGKKEKKKTKWMKDEDAVKQKRNCWK